MLALGSSVEPGTRDTLRFSFVKLAGIDMSVFQSTVTSPRFVILVILALGTMRTAYD